MAVPVPVRYYAQLRDALGRASEVVDLVLPARERDVLECLAALHPRQRELLLASRVAVEDGYADAIQGSAAASGIDIISPISGG